MNRLVPLLGLAVLIGISFLLSKNKDKINWKLVGIALLSQFVLGFLALGIPSLGIKAPLYFIFAAANSGMMAILNYTQEGSRFVFGGLLDIDKSSFIFAVQVLPTVVFFSSLMAVLYHFGVMQVIVNVIAKALQKTLGTSGAESLAMAANIFIGQTEAPLAIRPFLLRMTQSELLALMAGGMATIAGGVMAAFVGLLSDKIPNIAGHLLAASVLSAPAAFAIAKILKPETEIPESLGAVPKDVFETKDRNLFEAIARGATEGLKLAANIAAMLIAFIAIIALVDGILGEVGDLIGFSSWGAGLVPDILKVEGPARLSSTLIFGWLFSPMAWLLGIPWSEAPMAAALLGQKTTINEFVAYLSLSQWTEFFSDRTTIIMSYALCGFANFSSIGIVVGGIGSLVPERRSDLAKWGVYAMIAGTFAAFMTAMVAAILI